jgi:GT2 family glycosyltransferase
VSGPLAPPGPRASVVIPTHNRWAQLRRALDGYARQTVAPRDFDVLVCDDASDDETPERLGEYAATAPYSLRPLRQQKRGPAAARNLGIAHARAPVVVFTDDDCVPDPALLERHLARTRAGVATIGRIEWHPEIEVTPFMDFVCPGYMFNYGLIEDPEHATYQCFYTANVSVARPDLERLGGFDEQFPAAAYEDIELGYRLQRAGVRLVYDADALVYHLHEMTLAGQLARQGINGRAAAYAVTKHPEMLLEAGRVIRLRDPGVRRRFYDAALDYAFVAGLQAGLDERWGDPERPEAWVDRLDDELRAMAPRYEAVLEHKFYEAEAYARRLEDRVARLEEEYRRLAAWSARLDEALRRANPLKNRLRALLARRRPSRRPAVERGGARG